MSQRYILRCLCTGIFSSIVISSSFGQWSVPQVSTNLIHNNDMHFTNATTGFAVGTNQSPNGNAMVVKTTNGGSSWSVVYSLPPTVLPSSFTFNSLNFVTSNVAYATGGSPTSTKAIIAKTVNGGATWDTVSHNITGSGRVHDTYFFNANEGFCAAFDIHKTTDGGVTWTKITHPPGANGMRQIHFISRDTGYAIGNFGITCAQYSNATLRVNLNLLQYEKVSKTELFRKS